MYLIRFMHVMLLLIIHGKNASSFQLCYHRFHERYPQGGIHIRIKRCFSSEAILHLDKLLIPDAHYSTFNTAIPVAADTFPYALTKKQILQLKGTPICEHYEQIGPFWINIIGYLKQIDTIPIRVFYFFHGKTLCFAEYQCTKTTITSKTVLRDYLLTTFLQENSPNEDDFYIYDSNGIRILFYFNGFSACIKYINPACAEAIDSRLLALFK